MSNDCMKTRTQYVIIGSDYSAQEPRLLTQLCGDETLRETFESGRDPYATISQFVFHKDYWDCMEHHEDGSPNPDGKKLRKKAKQIMLGVMYGMGAKLMSINLGVSMDECKEILNEFAKMFPKIKEFTEYNEQCAKEKGYVEDYLGRRRHLPDAFLTELEIMPKRQVLTDADVIFDMNSSDRCIEIPDEEAWKMWNQKWAEFSQSRRFNAKKEFKETLKSNNVEYQDNGAFISKTMTQCTNARVQGCLSGDTMIDTKEYGIVPIKSVVHQRVTVWDGKAWSKSLVLPSGVKQKCIITFTNGQRMICSPNHRFALYEETTNDWSKLKFVAFKDLKPTDRVIQSISHNQLSDLMIHTLIMYSEFIPMYDVCDTERGYFVADGIVTHNSAASLTKKAMVAIHNDPLMRKYGFRLLIPVHDELLGECKMFYAREAQKRLSELMIQAGLPECSVKMKCDAYCVKHWYADEVSDQIHDTYVQYLSKGMSSEDAISKLCDTYKELQPNSIRKMCNEEFDVLSDLL